MGKPVVSPEYFSTFGDLLKYLRRREELTQRELALQVGYSDTQISRIEQNQRVPDEATLTALFVPALHIEREAEWVARLLELARQARLGNLSDTEATEKPIFPNNLPALLTTFIGREKELAEIMRLLSTHRLVTLTGSGGVGKTRIALKVGGQVLGEYANGVWLAELAPLSDPELLPQTVASVLGIVVQPTAISYTELLVNFLRAKTALLILDNCEHLLTACASLTDTLLKNCPKLKILATSREVLGILGEIQYRLPSLGLPDVQQTLEEIRNYESVRLFEERAQLAQPDFKVTTENASSVAQICSRLDGIPLAIELAAARINILSAAQIAERLDDRFNLLTGGSRTALPRQQTIRASIDWSWNLLSNSEGTLLRRLTVFADGWTLEAAESVCSAEDLDSHQVSELMTQLVAKSLVMANRQSGRERRFHLHETIHQYAYEKLVEAEEEENTRNHHLAYFLDLAENADKELHGPNQLEWLSRLGTVVNNLRAALDWAIETGQTELALRIARKFDWFWFVRANHNEGRQWLKRVLTLPDISSHPKAQAQILTQLAHHTWLQIGAEEARPFAEQALAIARTHADKQNTAWALDMLGLVLIKESNFLTAQTTLAESKTLFREIHDEWGYSHAILCLGYAAYSQDDRVTSIDLLEQALAGFRKLGDRYFASVCLHYIGILRVRQSQLIRAAEALREALFLVQQLDSTLQIAFVLWNFADIARAEGNSARAVCLYCAIREIFDSVGAWGAENDESEFENAIASCRAELEETEFAEAEAQGRAMSMDQAIAYALEMG